MRQQECWSEVGWIKNGGLTFGRRDRQVALVLAAARCSRRSVRVGVLPLVQQVLGLLDD